MDLILTWKKIEIRGASSCKRRVTYLMMNKIAVVDRVIELFKKIVLGDITWVPMFCYYVPTHSQLCGDISCVNEGSGPPLHTSYSEKQVMGGIFTMPGLEGDILQHDFESLTHQCSLRVMAYLSIKRSEP